MRRVHIDHIQEGMELGRNIFSADGRILLGAGVKLTGYYIARLKALGISAVFIHDERLGDFEFPEIISEQSRIQTLTAIRDCFINLQQSRNMNVARVKGAVNTLIEDILSNNQTMIGLTDICSFDDCTYQHSLNVCILSLIVGMGLNYSQEQLLEIGTGALLHDVGKTQVDISILNKEEPLTETEFGEIKNHCQYGFDILRSYEELSLLSAHIAFQHHEKWNGQGYPRSLAGNRIHEYARITAAADVYDALMSDRPYHHPFTLPEAITILQKMEGSHLDPAITEALIKNIAIYPVGSIVELNTGKLAVVIKVSKEKPYYPVVRIIYNLRTKKTTSFYELDLSNTSTISIVRVLSEMEIQEYLA